MYAHSSLCWHSPVSGGSSVLAPSARSLHSGKLGEPAKDGGGELGNPGGGKPAKSESISAYASTPASTWSRTCVNAAACSEPTTIIFGLHTRSECASGSPVLCVL